MEFEEEGTAGSITVRLGHLKAGDDDATRFVWDNLIRRLMRYARARLDPVRHGLAGADADEEDVAVEAMHSLFRGAKAGRFPRLNDREDLWRLLQHITKLKVYDRLQSAKAQKRVHVLYENAIGGPDGDGGNLDAVLGARLVRFAGSPLDVLSVDLGRGTDEILDEGCRRLLGLLGDPILEEIALLKMDGYSNKEIANKIGCARETIHRKVRLIKQAWGANSEME